MNATDALFWLLRTPRIPDHDRYWVSGGSSIALTPTLDLDLGYARLFSENSRIENADPFTGHVVRGGYAGSGNLFSGQITWRFR